MGEFNGSLFSYAVRFVIVLLSASVMADHFLVLGFYLDLLVLCITKFCLHVLFLCDRNVVLGMYLPFLTPRSCYYLLVDDMQSFQNLILYSACTLSFFTSMYPGS